MTILGELVEQHTTNGSGAHMHDSAWIREQLLPTIARFVESRVKPLRQRIDELEKMQREFCYRGVWAVGSYKRGNFVTHDGSVWHCDADNTDCKPGTDGSMWTLAVKHGKDFTDSPKRLPTNGGPRPQPEQRRA